jgi:hypothetical protein
MENTGYDLSNLPDILAAEDISRIFRVGLSGARRIIQRDFRHFKVGKRNFVSKAAFLTGLAAREVGPSVPVPVPVRFESGLLDMLHRKRPNIPTRKQAG